MLDQKVDESSHLGCHETTVRKYGTDGGLGGNLGKVGQNLDELAAAYGVTDQPLGKEDDAQTSGGGFEQRRSRAGTEDSRHRDRLGPSGNAEGPGAVARTNAKGQAIVLA